MSSRVEEGVGLMDVTIAITILLLVLVPAALLITSINSSAGAADHRVVALGVASGYVDEIQGLQGNVPPGGAPPTSPSYNSSSVAPYDAYLGNCGGTTSCTSWPATTQNGSQFPSQKVDGITYTITAAGGWCQEGTVNGVTSWVQFPAASPVTTNYAPPVGAPSPANIYGYWIAVRVTWGEAQSTTGQIVQYAALLPPSQSVSSGWPTLGTFLSFPLVAGTAFSCPTNLS
ncbi:MAG TPA: hypothetical protein VKG43_11350 [Acidimicrobiales bacterium]|nr:hypothetical protein [Acidimicrobiales bacterium]